jgi:hypothetical protein
MGQLLGTDEIWGIGWRCHGGLTNAKKKLGGWRGAGPSGYWSSAFRGFAKFQHGSNTATTTLNGTQVDRVSRLLTVNLARCLSIVVHERSMLLVATARGSSHFADSLGGSGLWQKPRWSHDLETIELLNSTDGTRVGPANRHAEKRETFGLAGADRRFCVGRLTILGLKTCQQRHACRSAPLQAG